jgi:hypothetical protein
VDGGATFTRITRCRFRQQNSLVIRLNACFDTRVDHCDFSDWLNTTNTNCAVRFWSAPPTCRRILVDYCYIDDVNPTEGSNGSDVIGRSGATGAFDLDQEFIGHHCLFRNVTNTNDS